MFSLSLAARSLVYTAILAALAAYIFPIFQSSNLSNITLSHSATSNNNNNNSAEMSVQRTIRKAFLALEQAEGQGARVRRSIGTPQLRNFSPFLMLDHFSVKAPAGFPDQ